MFLRNATLAGVAMVAMGIMAVPAQAALVEYVNQKDDSFSWKLKEKIQSDLGTIYDIELTSQTWQGIKWQHQLQVYLPKDVAATKTMVLWNTGGKASPLQQLIALTVAQKIKAPVAFLFHVPNQPIFEKKEDALIAETFVRYLKDGGKDESWPLLFPMVKSVVKAMDAIQAFSKEEWKQPVEKFIITGGSKRGWTSWLTAATGDPRVKAIAPMVIDTLNMKDQMEKQLRDFGDYSKMIHDYTEAKLVPLPDTGEARKLWAMIDPYFYRDRLTVPKLIINGNNDPYWTTDALNLYWDGLPGEKHILYVPNAGHDLRQKERPMLEQFDVALNGLAAFCKHQIADNPMPELKWKHEDANGKLKLTVRTSEKPTVGRLWMAKSATRDFRESKWESQDLTIVEIGSGTGTVAEVEPPKEGCLAFYAEFQFEFDGIKHSVCTQIRVEGKPGKK